MCFAFTMLGLQVFTPFGGLFNAGQIDGPLFYVSRYENVEGRTRNKVRKCPVTAEESCPLKCHLIKQTILTNLNRCCSQDLFVI